MTTSIRSAQIFFPASELSTIERISRGMGWRLIIPNDVPDYPKNEKEQILMESFGAWGNDAGATCSTEELCAEIKRMMSGNDFIDKYM